MVNGTEKHKSVSKLVPSGACVNTPLSTFLPPYPGLGLGLYPRVVVRFCVCLSVYYQFCWVVSFSSLQIFSGVLSLFRGCSGLSSVTLCNRLTANKTNCRPRQAD